MTKAADKPEWRSARGCGSTTCVEVARVGDRYLIRDSKHPDAPVLSFSAQEWHTFVAGVRDGDFLF